MPRGQRLIVVTALLAGTLAAGCGSDAGTTGRLGTAGGSAVAAAPAGGAGAPSMAAGGNAPGMSPVPPTTPSAPAAPETAAAPSSTQPALAASTAAPAAPAGGPITATMSALRLPYALSRTVAFADGGSILVCGGLTPSGTTATILRVDVAHGRLTRAGHLASAVHDAAGAMLGHEALVLGGGVVSQRALVQRVAASGRASILGHLPAARADLAAVTAGPALVVLGGGALGRADRRVLLTLDGIRFRTVAMLAVGVRYAAVAEMGGRIYLFGGSSATGDVATIQVVDTTTGTASVVGHLSAALSHATALVVGGRILIAGGRRAGRPVDTILAFNPNTNRTALVGHLPRPMSDAAAAVIGRTGYLIGGEAAAPLSSIVVLSPG